MKTDYRQPTSAALTDAAPPAATEPVPEPLWVRILYMLLFAVIYSIAELMAKVTVLVQLVFRACSGNTQRSLLAFSAGLSAYIHAIWRYLAFNDEQRPWPYSPWPKG